MNAEQEHCGSRLPLEGIRVVDINVAWAGPYATLFLADWGAEVIHIESLQVFNPGSRGMTARPKSVEEYQRIWSRAYPDWEPGPHPWNRYSGFNCHSRNKLSATVDLMRPEGVDLLKELVAISDIVIENNTPTAMEKLGVTYEVLKKVKPDLVMIRMPAYGLTGPYRNYRAWGSHVEAVIGHTWLRGHRHIDQSLKDDVYTSDAMGGITAAFAALVALRHRDLTGEGQLIDVALSEVVPPFLAGAIMDYTMNGRVQSTLGNIDTSNAPQGCYRCKGEDQWVTISVTSDQEWEGLRKAMGNPSWANDERYGNALGRWRNQEEIDQHIQAWTSQMESRDVMYRLQEEGVPAGMVMDEAELYQDPQLAHLGFFEEVTHPETGTHRYPGIIGRLGHLPNSTRRPAPCLGEHNSYVYRELMGLSRQRYEELEATGHIGTEYAPHVQ